jgi:serine/threonine-protein kinase
LALDPDNMRAQELLSYSILSRTGDPARALAVLRGDHPRLDLTRVSLLWWQRDYSAALAILETMPDSPDLFENSKAEVLGWMYGYMGETGRARHYYALAEEKARQALADAEAGDPVGDYVFSVIDARQAMAEIELGLGHTEEAVRLTDETQVLVDGLDDDYLAAGSSLANASIYSSVGRVDLAVSLLDRILAAPNGGFAYSPALLSIDPDLDPIRDDPRFIALLKKYPAPSVLTAGDGQQGTSIPTR